jgi:3'(2'), 5'-bisphosphate nucleotidase
MKELAGEIVRIAKEAGDKILEIYADESRFGVELKKDESPLTLADKSANAIIVAGLEKLYTLYPIISEENKLQPYEERKHYERFWLVDPLDGTKEFIKRNGEFTVNIALIEDGIPILGVVTVPVTGDAYWGIKGQGAFHEDQRGVRRMLSAKRYTSKDAKLRVVCSRSHINTETQEFIDALVDPVKVSKGSSLKFLLIAAGEAEVYPRIGPTMEWDTAAAHIILEEAGGAVLQYETDKPLVYNKENLLNPFFIAQGNLQS